MIKRLLTCAFLFLACSCAIGADLSPIRLYGVEFTRADQRRPIAGETFEAIRRAVAPRPLVVSSVSLEELDRLVSERRADIVITVSGIYRRHLRNGMRDIATLVTSDQPDPDHAIGAVLLAPKESGIRTLEDLRGKTIALNPRRPSREPSRSRKSCTTGATTPKISSAKSSISARTEPFASRP